MNDPIRILVVDDLKTDFELAQTEIRRSVKDSTFRLVKTHKDFLDALGNFQPDLILSEFSLPHFDGMKALELTLEHAPLTPFIIWTGPKGEESAVECMKAGAANYILKDNVKRLGPAAAHALEEGRRLLERDMAELRYRALFEQSHDAIFILDLEGHHLAANHRAAELMGYSLDEIKNLSMHDLSAEAEESERIRQRLIRGEIIPPYESLFRKEDGTLVPVEVNVELVYDVHRKPSHIQSIVRDKSDRKRDEMELRRRNEYLGLLNAINEAVVRGESVDAIVDILAAEVKRIFSATGTTVYMLNPDGKSITLRQYRTSPAVLQRIEGVIGSTVPLIQIPIRQGGFFQKALDSNGGMILSDPAEIQSWMEEFTETNFLPAAAKSVVRKLIPQIYKILNINSVVVVPLVSNGRTIGLLDISSSVFFTQNELERVGDISRQLTAAIQRQQANERVRRSEEFLQSVQNALSASIAILDETGTIIRVNSAWRKFGEMNGFRHSDHGIGLNYLEICDSVRGEAEEDAREVAAAIREVISGTKEAARFEYAGHGPVEKNWFVLRITKFEDMDRTWVVLAHDKITERKQAEQALLESERRYHALFENSPVAIWEEDFSGLKHYIDLLKQQGVKDFRSYFQSHPEYLVHCAGLIKVNDVNNKALMLYEAESKEQLIEEAKRILTEGEQNHNLEDIVAVAENRTSNSWEGDDKTLRGRPFEINLTWSVAPGHENDYSRVIVTTVDVTERNQAGQALHESEARYRGLFENTPIAIWEEDFSEVKKYLDALKQKGVADFRAYFTSHPEEMIRCKKMVRIVDVNQAALEMYEAKDKQELMRVSMEDFSKGELENLIDDLTAVAEGRTSNEWEGADETLTGRHIQVNLKRSVAQGHEEDYSKVIVTTVDVTERSQAEINLKSRESIISAVAYSAQQLIDATNWEQIVPDVLKILGEATNVSRVYIFQNHVAADQTLLTSQRFEWTAAGIEPQIDNPDLQNLPFVDAGFSRWIGLLEGNGVVVGKVDEFPVDEQEILSPQNILSIVVVPIFMGEQWWGFIGFDDCKCARNWDGSEIDALKTAAGNLGSAIQRHGVEEALRQSEERHRSLFDRILDGVYRSTHEGRFVDINPAMVRMFGYSSMEEMLAVDIKKELYFLPEERGSHLLDTGQEEVDVYRMRRKDGSEIWVEDRGSYVHDADGNIIYHEGILRDVTDRIRREEELRQSEARYRTVVENQTEFIVRWQADGERTFVNDAYCRYFGITQEQALSASFMPLVHEEDRPMIEDKIFRLLSGEITSETDIHRVIKPDGGIGWQEWTDQAILDMNGRAIEFQSVGRDITERKQAEDALQEAEVKYRNLVERLPVIVYTAEMGENGKWTYVSPQIETLLGFSPEEWKDDPGLWFRQMNPDDRDRHQRVEELAWADDEPFDAEYRLSRSDGKEIWIRDVGIIFPSPEGGAPIVQGTLMDVTDRKQAENELRRSNSLLNATLEATKDGILVVGEDRKITSFNRKYLELWRIPYSLAEKRDDHAVLEFVMSQVESPDRFIKRVDEIYSMPDVESFDELEFTDGRVFERHSQPQRLGGEIVGRVWSFRDITERKQAEKELRESEQRVQDVIQHSTSMFYSHTVDHDLTYVSPQSRQLLECEPEEAIKRWQEWLSDHPANEEGIKSTERAILTGERQPPYELELITKKKRRLWVRVDESPVIENGKTVAIVGSITDITDRKQAEEQLRKLSRAVEQSGSIILITGRTGNIEYVNPRFTEATGYTSEEVLGQNPRILKSGQTPQEEYERLWSTINSGEDWQGEFLNRRKNGELYWEYATVSPILNERGETTHFIAVKEDVTERKRNERDISRHLAELEALYENGLAVGQLLEPREIGERIIDTFSKHLPWHHVAIRLRKSGTDDLELIAYSLPHTKKEKETEAYLVKRVSKVEQGITGWVVQTGKPIRTGNVHEYPQYVNTYEGIHSGLYMPFKIGDRVLGVISVESEEPDAFTAQDERLLATLANQAAVAFENARLYQSIQQELAERRRAQDALRTSEAHYRELADSITDIFFEFDQNLHFTHWNKTSEIMTGVPAEDAIGKDMAEVFGESNELPRVREIYSSVLQTHRPRTFETVFALNRDVRSFEINAYPSTRGVSVVAKDVTDRKRSETIMQKRFELMEFSAHHLLEEVARKITDEVCELTGSTIGFFHFMTDDEMTIRMQVCSTNAHHLFDDTAGGGDHSPVNEAGVWAEAVRQRRSLIHNDYGSLADKKGMPPGHAEIVREILIPVIRNEKIVAVLGVANKVREYTQQDLEIAMQFTDYAWDVTERKQMEVALASERNLLVQRVEERTSELRASNANLARALRVKDEFLANMSHELRTPLNAVLGLSESLSEQVAGPLNEKQLRYVTTISESGHHLLSLINDILDLAKIEAGQVKLDINKVDVNSVSEASLRMVRQLAQKKNQEVSIDIAPDLGLIWADERRLKQMIVNLLSNSVKFTPENGRIGLEVRGEAGDNKVMITVWDNGIGIKEADLSRLFQPFMQLDAGLARESSGTGLGLTLVSQMARLHGGGVKVESTPGQGSRFTIVLPWQPAVPMSYEEKLRQTGKLGPPNTESKNQAKILLIEDTREVVMMIQDYLEIEGYTVITAQDGLDGIAQAKLTQPDLILMDLQMPRMDGLEAARKLRSEPGFKYTPIIAVTALAMPNDRERCISAGMNEYITKPVNLKALVKTIKKCLSAVEEKTGSL